MIIKLEHLAIAAPTPSLYAVNKDIRGEPCVAFREFWGAPVSLFSFKWLPRDQGSSPSKLALLPFCYRPSNTTRAVAVRCTVRCTVLWYGTVRTFFTKFLKIDTVYTVRYGMVYCMVRFFAGWLCNLLGCAICCC